jgi:hypothetical protein
LLNIFDMATTRRYCLNNPDGSCYICDEYTYIYKIYRVMKKKCPRLKLKCPFLSKVCVLCIGSMDVRCRQVAWRGITDATVSLT